MTNRRSTTLVLLAWLMLLAGCGQVSRPIEEDVAFAPPAVATQALSWSIETLDVNDAPDGPVAMAVASDGTRHIAYIDCYDDVVRYVAGQGGSWSEAETVGIAQSGYLDAGSLAIAVGSDGVPRVAYFDDHAALAFATRTDGAWPATADVVAPYASRLSLALDDDDGAHLVYDDGSGLRHAEQTSAGWTVSTVVASPSIGGAAVALDAQGRPHVAFETSEYVSPTYWVRLGYAEASYDAAGQIAWGPATVVAAYANATTMGRTALALDASGHPHIAYRSGFGHMTFVAHDGTAWGTPEAVELADADAPSLAFDDSGTPHVAYLVRPAGVFADTVRYAVRGDAGWRTETVDDAGDAGTPALVIDALDRLAIAYTMGTETADTLRYATVAEPVTSYVVTNSLDDGAGSLRQMVLDAPAGATITFATDVPEVNLTSGSLELTKDVTIAGPEDGTVTIQGNDTFTVIHLPFGAVDVTLRDLTITGGKADGTYGYGGGIRVDWPGAWSTTEPSSLRLERCTVRGNAADEGGGLYVEGNLTIDASTISGNTADGTGGGIEYVGTDLDEAWTYTASATIRNSTLSGNVSATGGAALDNISGEVTILFSTITGNATTNSDQGGGILSSADDATRVSLKGSIVVGNTSWWMEELADDVSGGGTNLHYESLGYNLIGAGGGSIDFDVQFRAAGDLTGVTDAGLGALADNGGPTLTHAPAATSLALGRVPPSACTDLEGTGLDSDQRGEARPVGSNCDAGAVESTDTITSYVLDVAATPTEGGSVSGAGSYTAGTTATLTATPAEHWHFVEWRGDASGTATTATIAMDGNRAAIATFALDVHRVQGSVEPTGSGSVVHDPASADGTYAYGTNLTLDPVAAAGYAFAHWNDDSTATSDPWTFDVTEDMSYTAHFVPVRQLTLVVDPATCTDCRIDASPSGGAYPEGEVVTLTAVAATDWAFVSWTGVDTSDGATATVTMSADRTVTAAFVQESFTVTTDKVGEGTVAVTPLQATYVSGTPVTFTAYPATGWRFDHWNDDPAWTKNPETFEVTADVAMTANFVQTHILTVFTTDGGGVLVDPNPPYDHSDVVTLEARPFTGWHFTGWSGDASGVDPVFKLTMDADKTVTAHFERNAFTVTWTSDGEGTVVKTPDQETYPYEAWVQLEAKPASGWRFDHWNDDADWVENPIDAQVTGNVVMTAHFVQTIALVVTPEGDGIVNVAPEGPYEVGDTVTLTAIEADGWFFQKWTGDLAGEPNPATVVLEGDVSAGAIFLPIVGPMVHVALGGDGDGYVTSEPAGIDCHASGASICVASFPRNTKLTLTAVAADGAAFLRWDGSVVDIAPDMSLRLREDVQETAHFVALNGPEVAIDPTGSFRGNTAVVTGSLVCASGTHDLDVSIVQVVPVKKGDPVTITASTTVVGAVCGQPWTATLVAVDGRFARGEADVTVKIGSDVLRERTIELR